MSGLLLKTITFLSKELTRKSVKNIKPSITNSHIKPPKEWTHKVKIEELKNDEFVSGDYLKGLIEKSKTKLDLQKIQDYLSSNGKVGNLDKKEIGQLKAKIGDKLDQIDMKEILKKFRENGNISMSDWWDYFV